MHNNNDDDNNNNNSLFTEMVMARDVEYIIK